MMRIIYLVLSHFLTSRVTLIPTFLTVFTPRGENGAHRCCQNVGLYRGEADILDIPGVLCPEV